MTFAFLLTSGPERQDRHTLAQLAEAALRLGHRVRIFIMGDGVVHRDWLNERFAAAIEAGDGRCEVAVCAHNALTCGLKEAAGGLIWGSQSEWARYVNEADRVIAFG